MKLWEALKELNENPKKMFTHQDSEKKWTLYTDFEEGHREWRPIFMLHCVDDEGEDITDLVSGNFSGNIYTDTDWQEVKQPVTWQEAIQAGSKGRMVRVEFEDGYKKQLDLFNRNTFSFGDINNGTWYIED